METRKVEERGRCGLRNTITQHYLTLLSHFIHAFVYSSSQESLNPPTVAEGELSLCERNPQNLISVWNVITMLFRWSNVGEKFQGLLWLMCVVNRKNKSWPVAWLTVTTAGGLHRPCCHLWDLNIVLGSTLSYIWQYRLKRNSVFMAKRNMRFLSPKIPQLLPTKKYQLEQNNCKFAKIKVYSVRINFIGSRK